MGAESVDEVANELGALMKAKPPTSFKEAIKLLSLALDLRHAKPKTVKSGSCKDVTVKQIAELVNTAIDLGINSIDTAPAYGAGQSETNVGRVMKTRRREVWLSSKTPKFTYDEAMISSAGVGPGFVLNGDGIVCIDLDHCLTGRVLEPWAADILAACPGTYIEVSPSGDGLHIWGRALDFDGGRRVERIREILQHRYR